MRTRKAWTTPAEKPSELLERAYNLLKGPRRWCKGAYGKWKDGYAPIVVPDEMPNATGLESFCSLGAIYRTMDGTPHFVRAKAIVHLANALQEVKPYGEDHDGVVHYFNDAATTKKRDVLKVFKHAIKLAKEVENG